nr:MAG TPA: hypothetical protein [Caudoviricetes sp.]
MKNITITLYGSFPPFVTIKTFDSFRCYVTIHFFKFIRVLCYYLFL